MSMLKNHFIIAWRNLWKHKLTSIINILGVSLGMVSALVIFNLVKYELSFDRTYLLSNQTFRVVERMNLQEGVDYRNTTAYPLAEALRSEFPQLKYVTQTHGPVSGIVNGVNEAVPSLFEEDQLLFVDSFYLEVFDAQWLHGNRDAALRNLQSVILTKSMAHKYFPETTANQHAVLGKTLKINVPGQFQEIFEITGVIDDPLPNVTFRYSMLLPYAFYQKQNSFATGNWSGNYQGTTFITLSEDQEPADIESLFPSFKSKYLSPEDDERKSYYLQPLIEIHTDGKYGSAPGSYVLPKKYLYGVVVLGILILILGAANFVSLSTAQAINRVKEVGVRRAIGSSRWQLVTQFLCETFTLCILAGLLALPLSSKVLTALNEILGLISLQLSFDSSMWLATIILVLAMTILAGLYPAIIVSGVNSFGGFSSSLGSNIHGKAPLRKSLLVLQFAICQLLLAATLIVAWQMKFLNSKELGFTQDEIVTIPIPEYDLERLQALKFRLTQNSGIKQVSFASGVPTAHNLMLGTTVRLKEAEVNQQQWAEMKVVDQDYIKTYDLNLIAGKGIALMKEDGSFNGFVVNETLVKALGLSPNDAIGEEIVINEGQAPIIGVVADFHNTSLKEEITPCLIFNWYPDFLWEAGIKIIPGNTAAALEHIQRSWEEFFPQSVYRFQFLQEYLNGIYALERLLLLFVKAAMVLAIIIGCLGLYGLVTFSVTQRTKEMGMRKILGASTQHILAIFTSEYIKLIGLAFVIATPLSWYFMDRWLDGFVYRINIGIGIFFLTLMVVLAAAITAVSYRLWVVVRSNPADSLRNE